MAQTLCQGVLSELANHLLLTPRLWRRRRYAAFGAALLFVMGLLALACTAAIHVAYDLLWGPDPARFGFRTNLAMEFALVAFHVAAVAAGVWLVGRLGQIRIRENAMDDLPPPVAGLADRLAAMPGTVAVVLGGSRGLGRGDGTSDWDLGVYYRGAVDLTDLAAPGVVHPPGSWGRIMNGGAWLRLGGEKVDVILRDLDVVEHWARRAEQGEFELDALPGTSRASRPTASPRSWPRAACSGATSPRRRHSRRGSWPMPRRGGGSAGRSAWTMRGCTPGAGTSSGRSDRRRRRRWRRPTRSCASAADGC